MLRRLVSCRPSPHLLLSLRCLHTSAPCMADIEDATLQRIVALHQQAVLERSDTYIDPLSGYKVFTSAALGRRKCCGNACRHCPYQYQGVKENNRAFISDTNLRIRRVQEELHPGSLTTARPPSASPRASPEPASPTSPCASAPSSAPSE